MEAGQVGLRLHMGKTKILSNVEYRRGVLAQKEVLVHGSPVEVLPFHGATSYLGRLFSFSDIHGVEIRQRIQKGWAAFGKFREELCGKHYPLAYRMRLFNSVVSSTVVYGSGAWTMTVERENLLRTAFRRMLRKIIGVKRKHHETYLDWITRATHHSEHLAGQHGFENWISLQKQRKFALHAKITGCTDSRWGQVLLHWEPLCTSCPGRPRNRWQDVIS